MDISATMAVVAVADLEQATDFYDKLFGRPADQEPMPTLSQWDFGAGAFQLVVDPERAGSSMATLLVPDLDAILAAFDDLALNFTPAVDGAVSRLTQVTDPAGNLLTFAQVHSA